MSGPDHNQRWEVAVHAARVRPLTGKAVLDSATCLHIDAELTRLRAENEALRADAERYRLLRNASMDERNRLEHYAGPALDAAIDAAKGEK